MLVNFQGNFFFSLYPIHKYLKNPAPDDFQLINGKVFFLFISASFKVQVSICGIYRDKYVVKREFPTLHKKNADMNFSGVRSFFSLIIQIVGSPKSRFKIRYIH